MHRSARIGANVRIGNGSIIEEDVTLTGHCHVPDGAKISAGVCAESAVLPSYCPPRSIWNKDGFQGFVPVKRPPRKDNPLLAHEAIDAILKHEPFTSVLDVGSGAGLHAEQFLNAGKCVTQVDFGTSYYYQKSPRETVIKGNYLNISLQSEFDCVWASHVLEHQPNPGVFIAKLVHDTKEDGLLCITVPPFKTEVVGGHLSLWTSGLLMYHLAFAGLNCREIRIKKYGYNITAILRKKTEKLPDLDYDYGDIDRLKPLLPDGFAEPFDGDFPEYNWYK